MGKLVIVGILAIVGLAFLLAISLLGPGDWGQRDPDERARRELQQRHYELSLIMDFYVLLAEPRYGRAYNATGKKGQLLNVIAQ